MAGANFVSVFVISQHFSGYIVNLVDGLIWSQEAAGSNPATPTKLISECELIGKLPRPERGYHVSSTLTTLTIVLIF